MFNFQIKTHRSEAIYSRPHFFILNKGNNSGKPLNQPCPNCFVCLCSSEEEKEQLYWLMLGLCQSKRFYPYLCGSVIPFLKIKDVKDLVKKLSLQCAANPEQCKKKVATIQKVQIAKNSLSQQLQTLQQLQNTLLSELLRAG
jgi:hypothetical protein